MTFRLNYLRQSFVIKKENWMDYLDLSFIEKIIDYRLIYRRVTDFKINNCSILSTCNIDINFNFQAVDIYVTIYERTYLFAS